MTRRGRLPSPDCTRIAILGLLCRHGAKHGYEIRKLIEGQNIDTFADIQFGSIYAALKRLRDEGYLKENRPSREGKRPAKTTYEITELGKKELKSLIEHAFTDQQQAERPVDLAVHFSGLLPVEDVISLLEERVAVLERYEKVIRRAREVTTHHDPGVQDLIRDINNHFHRINQAELAWSKSVLKNAANGAYRTGAVNLDVD